MKSNHSSRGDRDFFTGLGIAAWSLRLVAQLKVSESRKLYAITTLQGIPDFFEKSLDHVLGLTLVEADLLEQQVGEFCLGKRHSFPFSDAQLRCKCLLQIGHQLLHGGLNFSFEQRFLSILHHYAEGKAFLADINPAPDIDIEQTDIPHDGWPIGSQSSDQLLEVPVP
jgi:hypothetical protein